MILRPTSWVWHSVPGQNAEQACLWRLKASRFTVVRLGIKEIIFDGQAKCLNISQCNTTCLIQVHTEEMVHIGFNTITH